MSIFSAIVIIPIQCRWKITRLDIFHLIPGDDYKHACELCVYQNIQNMNLIWNSGWNEHYEFQQRRSGGWLIFGDQSWWRIFFSRTARRTRQSYFKRGIGRRRRQKKRAMAAKIRGREGEGERCLAQKRVRTSGEWEILYESRGFEMRIYGRFVKRRRRRGNIVSNKTSSSELLRPLPNGTYRFWVLRSRK